MNLNELIKDMNTQEAEDVVRNNEILCFESADDVFQAHSEGKSIDPTGMHSKTFTGE